MNEKSINIDEMLRMAIKTVKPNAEFKMDVITSDLSLYELGIESVDLFEMAGFIEHEYNILLPDDQLSQIKTIGDIEKIVLEQIHSKGTEGQLPLS